MKRVISLMAATTSLALCLCIAGCASGGSATSAASSSGAAESASAASSASAAAVESSTAAAESSADASDVSASSTAASVLENGTYSVAVDTGSSMFHVNEADEGRGMLTVTDEGMTLHMRLVSKKIVNLYMGTPEQAEADEAGALQPSPDKVTYADGYEEEVYGFDVPVPALDEPFTVSILGSKGTWYEHEVTVSDPISE